MLYNYLQALQGGLKVTMHNIGNIDSIANVIFLSGGQRFASPNASFHFHGVSMNITGPVNRNALKEHLSRCEGMENRIITTISAYQGYYTKGGTREVGISSTRAVVYSDVVILIMNYLLTQLLLI